jgi:hypothetical protein
MRGQMMEVLMLNKLLDPLQSGFKANDSTTTALLKVVDDLNGDCVATLNDNLDQIHSMSNGLLLNPNKTRAMFICRSRAAVAPPPVVVAGVKIPYSSKFCDLGMILNDRLTFDDHINDLCSKVHYSLRVLLSAY